MKEPKSYLLTLVTGFLTLIVGMMLSITIYLYIKNQPRPVTVAGSGKAVPVPADALNKQASSIGKKDSFITSSSAAIEKLQNEINTLLADQTATVNLETNKKNIDEIEVLINQLRDKNNNVQKENELLYQKIQELKNTIESVSDRKKVIKNDDQKKTLSNASLQIESIQVKAITPAELNKETTKADQTEKLYGSLVFTRNGGKETNIEIMVVVTQPDGSVLQGSDWETGVFYTNKGKQIYTRKIRMSLTEGETRKIDFTLEAEKFFPGKYSIELYYMGAVIKTLTKVLY